MFSKEVRRAYLWSMKYLYQFKGVFVLVVISSLFLSAINLVLPKLLQVFTDSHMESKASVSMLVILVLLLGVMLALNTGIHALSNMWNTSLSQRALKDVHWDMFSHLRKLGIGYFERTPTGEILSLYHNEVASTQQLLTRMFPQMLGIFIFLVLGFTYLFSIHWLLTIAVIPFFFAYYIVAPYFERKAQRLSKEGAEQEAEVNKRIYNSVTSLLELRFYQADEWDAHKLDRKNTEANKVLMQACFHNLTRDAVRRQLLSLGSIFIMFLGVLLVRRESISVGEFIAFSSIVFLVLNQLAHLITMLTDQKDLSHRIVRLYDFMHLEGDVTESKQPKRLNEIQGEFQVDQVVFSYPNHREHPALQSLSLHIPSGHNVALVGPSGAGKSTLLKLLGRLYDPSAGRILLDGTDIRDLSFEQLRNAVGYVFQETYLFPGSIRENIQFGKEDATDEEVEVAAEAAYALEFIRDLPQGFDTEIGERGFKLSGGQKQRIALARLFLKNPPILLLDEATSALDNVSEKEVQKAIANLLEGRTTVTIAHRLSTVMHADTIYVIDDGMVAEQGTYDELMAHGGLFFNMVKQGEIGLKSEEDEGVRAS